MDDTALSQTRVIERKVAQPPDGHAPRGAYWRRFLGQRDRAVGGL